MGINAVQAQQVYERAECLFSESEVKSALDRVADEISTQLSAKNPLVLCVMTGGLMACSELLMRFDFPLEVDYLHATRYDDLTVGKNLKWIASPRKSLKDRDLLLIDDILDEGYTLQAIIKHCKEEGARTVRTAVLTQKKHNRNAGLAEADYTGLIVPDRYVFGFGMDYKGYWRNLPAIFAASKDDE